jgi:pimeloyl-ACP methyl ester carboxylesterase
MFGQVAFRWAVSTLVALCAAIPAFGASGGAISTRPDPGPAPANIVVGFVGGFVRHNNPHHGPVQLAQRIQSNSPSDTYVRVFENRHRKTAYNTILQLLDSDHDGVLTADEKTRARIILFGHSWGASAVVLLARELDRAGIPVLLTVQVDSVAKLWQSDGIIPENVAEAVNFYQPNGLIHGRSQISAADAGKTRILGNYLFDYKKAPVQCPGTSWYDRWVTPSHVQSECDPRLWTRVEALVRERLSAPITAGLPLP